MVIPILLKKYYIYILQIFLRLLAQKEHILLFSDFSKHRKNQPSTTSLSAKIIARHPPQNCFAKMWIQIQQAGYVYIYILKVFTPQNTLKRPLFIFLDSRRGLEIKIPGDSHFGVESKTSVSTCMPPY